MQLKYTVQEIHRMILLEIPHGLSKNVYLNLWYLHKLIAVMRSRQIL